MASFARQSILSRLCRDVPGPAGGMLTAEQKKTMRILDNARVDATPQWFVVESEIEDALERERA